MANKRKTQKRTIPASSTVGTVAGIILCIVLSGVAAFLMCSGSVKEERGAMLVPVILFLSAGTGCVIASKTAGEQIAVTCGLTGLLYIVVLLGITLFFFEGHFTGLIGKLVSVLVGSVAACILCAGKRKKRGSR